jgi:hypothetical protein
VHFTYLIDIEIEKTEGKFASRDEMDEQIQEALGDANPENLTGENDGEYDVIQWDIEEVPQPKKSRKKKDDA